MRRVLLAVIGDNVFQDESIKTGRVVFLDLLNSLLKEILGHLEIILKKLFLAEFGEELFLGEAQVGPSNRLDVLTCP